MERSGIMIYFTNCRMLDLLSDAQRGRVFQAVLAYARLGTEPEGLELCERVAFEAMRDSVDRDQKKYDEKVERLRENGRRGGRPRKTSKEEAAGQKKQTAAEKSKSGVISTSTPTSSSISTSTPTSSSSSSSSVSAARSETMTTMNGGGKEKQTPAGQGTAMPKAENAAPEGELAAFWAANFGRVLTPHERQVLASYLERGCGKDLVRLAMERAVEQHKPMLSYVTAILDDALGRGARDAAAYKACGGPGWKAPAGSPAARSGEGTHKAKYGFPKNWMAVFDEEPDLAEGKK